jgi:hypothetical protein
VLLKRRRYSTHTVSETNMSLVSSRATFIRRSKVRQSKTSGSDQGKGGRKVVKRRLLGDFTTSHMEIDMLERSYLLSQLCYAPTIRLEIQELGIWARPQVRRRVKNVC